MLRREVPIGDLSRECLATEVDFSLTGKRVARVLDELASKRGWPDGIVMDNGPELAGRDLDASAHGAGVRLLFIRPGKPVENAYIESFTSTWRCRQGFRVTPWWRPTQ